MEFGFAVRIAASVVWLVMAGFAKGDPSEAYWSFLIIANIWIASLFLN